MNNLFTILLTQKFADKGMSNKKIIAIMVLFSTMKIVISLVAVLTFVMFAKNRVENFYDTETAKNIASHIANEKQLENGFSQAEPASDASEEGYQLELEDLDSSYKKVYEKTNIIDNIEGQDREYLDEYNMEYVVIADERSYICSDGYYMYLLDCSSGVPNLESLRDDYGNSLTLNNFFKDSSK